MRIKLVAQHGEMRVRALRLEPEQLIVLLVDQQIEVDPVIQPRPGHQKRKIEQDRAEKLQARRHFAATIKSRMRPDFYRRENRRRDEHHEHRSAPGHTRRTIDELAEDHGHDQRQAIAGSGCDRSRHDKQGAHGIGNAAERTQHEIAGPAHRLEYPKGAILVADQRMGAYPLECHGMSLPDMAVSRKHTIKQCVRPFISSFGFIKVSQEYSMSRSSENRNSFAFPFYFDQRRIMCVFPLPG